MKEYNEYKKTEIFGLNKIPNDWAVLRLKNVGYLYGGLSGKSGEDFGQENSEYNRYYVPFKNIANNDIIDGSQLDLVEIKEGEKQNIVLPNDLLFLMSSENYEDIGKTALVKNIPENTYLNSFCKGFRVNNSIIDSAYLNYLLSADELRKALSKEAKGFTRINLQIAKITNLSICSPIKISEQTKIAQFLDHKTGLIDDLIQKKKELIKKLEEQRQAIINEAVTKGLNPNAKMKDSGVEWLGEIPEEWGFTNLKYLGACQNGISAGAEYFGTGQPFVSYSDVYKNEALPKEVKGLANSSPKEQVRYSVEEGDVFFTRTSETIEEIGLASVCHETIENAIFAGFVIRFRPFTDKINKDFAQFYFRSFIPRIFFVKEMNLVTRASLSQGLLKRLPICLPSLEEQSEIGNYLKDITYKIDSTTRLLKKTIDSMKLYRQSLISEAVTGKIDVREWEPKN